MLVRLADWCYRRRRAVVALWIAALVGSFALSSAFGGEFRQDYLQPGSESQAASDDARGPLPPAGRRHRPGRAARGRRHQLARRTGQGRDAPRRRRRERPRRRRRQPVHRRGSPPDLGGRHHGVRRGRAGQEGQRVHRGRGQDAGGADPGRRRRDPAGGGRRRGRRAVPDRTGRVGGHRARHRGRHPADHLRVRGGDGTAAAHRAVRSRDRDGAGFAADAGGRRPGVGPAHRGDGRHRCRHRLRPVHRHPVPQQPRRGPGSAPRHPDVRSRPPVAPCCSPASPSSRRCSASC